MTLEYRTITVRPAQQVERETEFCPSCHQPVPTSAIEIRPVLASSLELDSQEWWHGRPLPDALQIMAQQGWRLVSTIPGPLETILIFERNSVEKSR